MPTIDMGSRASTPDAGEREGSGTRQYVAVRLEHAASVHPVYRAAASMPHHSRHDGRAGQGRARRAPVRGASRPRVRRRVRGVRHDRHARSCSRTPRWTHGSRVRASRQTLVQGGPGHGAGERPGRRRVLPVRQGVARPAPGLPGPGAAPAEVRSPEGTWSPRWPLLVARRPGPPRPRPSPRPAPARGARRTRTTRRRSCRRPRCRTGGRRTTRSRVVTFSPPIAAPLPGAVGEPRGDLSPASDVGLHLLGDSLASFAFSSRGAAASTRAYQESPNSATSSR